MTAHHPSDDVLRKLVAGELDDATISQIEAHIQTCETVCQPKLDALSQQVREVTADAPALPGYADFVEIGRGGMGVVYEARHVSLNRPVAVKLLRPGLPPEKNAVLAARFRKEAQITGQLQHPGIPPVHDLGETADGRPCMVMRLIRGETLAKRIQVTREKNEPVGNLVGLFEKACDAVAYAHSKGVVHRDLKPQNIMVGSFNAVQVLDWGLAKRLEQVEATTAAETTQATGTVIETDPHDDSKTNAGALLGTVPFMSPEQAGGELDRVDQRSDVFGLGAILCAILTGHPPYASGRGEESLKLMAVRWETEEAFARLDACGADPEVVKLAKGCLAKRPEDRPADARAVANILAGLRAAADDRVRQAELGKVRADTRRRVMMWAGSIVAAVLTVGIAGTLVGLVEANRQKREAKRQEGLAVEEAAEKEKARAAEKDRADGEKRAKGVAEQKRAEAEANLAFAWKGYDLLSQLFGGSRSQSKQPTLDDLAAIARPAIENITKEMVEFGMTHPAEVAEAFNALALLARYYGDSSTSVELFEKAHAARHQVFGPDHEKTLTSANNYAQACSDRGAWKKAIPILEETLKRLSASLGPLDRGTLTTANNLAYAYHNDGQTDKGISLYLETLKRQTDAFGPDNRDTLQSANNLGQAYSDIRLPGKAIPLFEDALKRRINTSGPNDIDTLTTANNLAYAYLLDGQTEKAIPLYEDTLKRQSAVLGPNNRFTLRATANFASVFIVSDVKRAIPLLEDTLKRQLALVGPDTLDTLGTTHFLARAYQTAGRSDKAVPLFVDTLKRATAAGVPNRFTLMVANSLAHAYHYGEGLGLAIPLYQDTLKRQADAFGPDDRDTLQTANNLGQAFSDARDYPRAIPLLADTLTRRTVVFGPDHRETLQTANNLAFAYAAVGAPDKAFALYGDTLKRLDSAFGPSDRDALQAAHNLAHAYLSFDLPERALPIALDTLDRRKAVFGPNDRTTLQTSGLLASAYHAGGQVGKGLTLAEETLKRQVATLGPSHPDIFVTLSYLMYAYNESGAVERAVKTFRQFVEDLRKVSAPHPGPFANVLANLTLSLLQCRETLTAEEFCRECLAIREKIDPDLWTTFNTQSMLGEALLGQMKYTDAEPLLLKGYEGMKAREASIPAPAATRIPEALDRLIALYTATKKPDEVKKYRDLRSKYPPEVAPRPRPRPVK